MKSLIALLLCLVVPTTAFAGDNNYKVSYDGGSLQNVKSGTGIQLVLEPATIKIAHGKEELLSIPAASITEISYGQMYTGALGPRLVLQSFRWV